MTILVQLCPLCQHCRCENCPIYSQKGNQHYDTFSRVTLHYGVFKKDSVPKEFPAQSVPKALLSSSGPAYVHPYPKADLICC